MYAVVHCPRFPLQAVLRHEPEAWGCPVALVDSSATTPRVIEANDAAGGAGVVPGLTAPQALARCREVRIRGRSAAREAEAMAAVLQCAYGFSPHLEATGNGLVTLDLRGLASLREALAGKDEAGTAFCDWGQRLVSALSALGLQARVGIGGTPTVARHAARWGTDARTPVRVVREAAAFVAGLPVAALEPSDDVVGLLGRWGIRTVGELLALGQAELAERLGLEALGLFAAASVTATRPLQWVAPPETFEEAHEFENGIETLEPLLFLLRRFIDALSLRLTASGLVAGTLRLRLRLECGTELEHPLRLPEPTCRGDVLFRVLQTHLETVRTESMVRAVGLAVDPARPRQQQFSLFETAVRDPHQFHETLARLAALVGADRVGSPRRENHFRPDAFRLVPPEFDRGSEVGGSVPGSEGARPELQRVVPWRRLRPGQDAMLVLGSGDGAGDAAPTSVRGGRWGGAIREVAGPCRSSGHWWDERSWAREEWDVETREGWVLRVARENGAWRIEAVLD